jgi:outer membrane protein assembly factor BamA
MSAPRRIGFALLATLALTASAARAESPFAAAPLVVSSPSFGTGGGAAAMLFFHPTAGDTISPTSIAALIGLYSNTDSYVLGAFMRSYFQEDAWRLTAALATARVNCDYDVPGLGSVQFETDTRVVFARPEWRTRGRWYLGAMAAVAGISYREGNAASDEFFDLANVEDNASGAVGPCASFDTKDNPYFPEHGAYADFSYTAIPEWLGSSASYWVVQGEGDWYRLLPSRQVLALHAYGRFTPDNTPYSGLSTLGRTSDLRGYKSGKETAENLMSTQAELRWMLGPWGVVGFAGVATLYDGSLDAINQDSIFWSGGVGARIVLQKTNRMNLRLDYAWGEQDEQGAYVSIGEAF